MPASARAVGVVELDHLTKRYGLGLRRAHGRAAIPWADYEHGEGTFASVDDVSFRVEPGESFALIGANGAGKSTVLKCVANVVRPTSGRVSANGRVTSLIELGVGFHYDLSGIENLRFQAAIHGLRGADAARVVAAALDFAEIGQFADMQVKRYSSGMHARLSLGIAMNLPTDILLVDEVLAVGDMKFQRKCFEKMSHLRKDEGVTLLFVSHSEWVLKETCKRGVLLDKGAVVEQGSLDTLLRLYHTRADTVMDRPVSDHDPRIRVVSARVLPDDDRVIGLHSDITLRLTIDVDPDVTNAAVSIAMFDQSRRFIWASYSDENGIDIPAGRTTEFDVTVPDIDVLPGPCRIEVLAFERGIAQGDDLLYVDLTIDGDVPNKFEHGLVDARATWRRIDPHKPASGDRRSARPAPKKRTSTAR